MKRRILLPILILASCIVVFASGAQEGLREDLQVTLVSLYVSAVDSDRHYVPDLKPDDFSLYEDGAAQSINTFNTGNEDLSLTVGFLMDNSASISSADLEMARSAGLLLLQELKPTDKLLLITFRHSANAMVEPTFDKQKIEATIRSLQPQYGTTALYDSIYLAAGKLERELGRKVLLLFSDGQDNASTHRLNDLLAEVAGLSDITVVSIGTKLHPESARRYGALEDHRKGRAALEQLANLTGGFSVFPKDREELQKTVADLRNWIRNQYTIGYYPMNRKQDGSWRNIRLHCKRKGVRLSYRKGYFAPGQRDPVQTDSNSIPFENSESTQQR